MMWSVSPDSEFQVGGNLPPEATTYVSRAADRELLDAIRRGHYCYILNARQMGKSSLRVRAMRALQAEGVACAEIDLLVVTSDGVSAEEWFAGLVDSLNASFRLLPGAELAAWWRAHTFLAPAQRTAKFVDEIVLERTKENIAVFIDEIDTLLGVSFGDDVFTLVRSCFNQRADDARYRRLTFALIGVASPSELVRDRKRSPFNIGRAVELSGFSFEEAAPALAPGLAAVAEDPSELLREVLRWTGGQPFLTQKLCALAAGEAERAPAGGEGAWVERLVRTRVLTDWESKDSPVHLRTIRSRILEASGGRTGRLLGLYQRVLRGEEVVAEDPDEQMELRLSGLVVGVGGRFEVYNRIYREVFGEQWAEAALERLRPYAEALAAWTTSGKQQEAWLLGGEALRVAQTWAANKRLADADHEFLRASEHKEAEQVRLEAERKLEAEQEANRILADAKGAAERASAVAREGLKHYRKRVSQFTFGGIITVVAAALLVPIPALVWRSTLKNQAATMSREIAELTTEKEMLDAALSSTRYIKAVREARQSIDQGQLEQAKQLLDVQPDALRGFEWYYLSHLCDPSSERAISWDFSTGAPYGEKTVVGDHKPISAVCFDGDGQSVWVALRDGERPLVRQDLAGGAVEIEGIDEPLEDVALSPDGNLVAFCGNKGLIGLVEAKARGKITWLAKKELGNAKVTCLRFIGNDELLSGDERGGVKLWDLLKRGPTDSSPAPTGQHDVAVTSIAAYGATKAIVAYKNGAIVQWNIAGRRLAGATVLRLASQLSIPCVRYSPDGSQIAFSEDQSNSIYAMQLETRVVRPLVSKSGQVHKCLAFSPDGRRLVAGSYDSMLTIIDFKTGDLIDTIHKDNHPILCLDLCRQGTRLAYGTSGGTLQILP